MKLAANHAKPVAAISAPLRLAGRCDHATRPQAISDPADGEIRQPVARLAPAEGHHSAAIPSAAPAGQRSSRGARTAVSHERRERLARELSLREESRAFAAARRGRTRPPRGSRSARRAAARAIAVNRSATAKPSRSGSWMSRSTTSGRRRSVSAMAPAVGSLTDHGEALRLEQRGRGVPERRVVVDDQNRRTHEPIVPASRATALGLAAIPQNQEPCDHGPKTVVSPVSAVTTRSYRRSSPADERNDMMPAKLRPVPPQRCLFRWPRSSRLPRPARWRSAAGLRRRSRVSCGDTITADTTLDSDLVDCPSNGIVIGADDITLDLNGHTVAGDGEPSRRVREAEFCDVGVLNDGHDGVTVMTAPCASSPAGSSSAGHAQNRVLDISSSRNRSSAS